MKIYDSSVYPVVATADGVTPVVHLTTQQVGSPMPDKAVTQTGNHMTISNALLEFQGKRLTGMLSDITLTGVVGGDTLNIGAKPYAAGTQFTVGGSDAATAVNLAAAINAPVLVAQPPWVFNYENLNIAAKVSGTGSVNATVDIEHSLNGVDWTVLVSLSPTGTTSAVLESAQTKAKPLLRVKPSVLTGTGAKLEVFVAPAPV